jgi:hypothetical protein
MQVKNERESFQFILLRLVKDSLSSEAQWLLTATIVMAISVMYKVRVALTRKHMTTLHSHLHA